MKSYTSMVSILAAAALAGISPSMAKEVHGQSYQRQAERVAGDESADQHLDGKINAAVKLFQFRPERLEVKAGTTVTWINEDEIYHTITADDQSFGAPLDGKGKKFTFTFNRPGAYTYHCERHEHMRGEIDVR
jgi:plastocyanin